MPRVVVTAGALRGLERCRRFLVEKDRRAAVRAGSVSERHLQLLETAPAMGRPLDDQPELRELVIGFGEDGYVALYRYVPATKRSLCSHSDIRGKLGIEPEACPRLLHAIYKAASSQCA